jgi:hypothetical protein
MDPFRRRAVALLVPLLALAGAAACGEDDDPEASASSTTAAAAEADGADAAEAVDVVAVDYHFEGLPERVDAGTALTLRNDSEGEVHELVAMAIPPGETRPVDELVALPEDQLFAAVPGEPALVMVAPPGEEAITVLGDEVLPAGRYLVLCAIPTGADPDEFMAAVESSTGGPPDVAGGPPHLVSGMYAELVVG